jgi:hypothetical protein
MKNRAYKYGSISDDGSKNRLTYCNSVERYDHES